MAISTRTPGGSSGQCPVCGSVVEIEPSLPCGDARCPACGTLLIFILGAGDDTAMFVKSEIPPKQLEHLAEANRAGGLDSLWLVEFIMELECR